MRPGRFTIVVSHPYWEGRVDSKFDTIAAALFFGLP
jgi:hypothetical protein